MRSWRTRIFVTTWLAYVGFYFCRQPYFSTKAEIGQEMGWSARTLGDIEAAYLIAYAIGQFLASGMGTKLGPRRNVLIGMALSIVVTLAMGIPLTVEHMMVLVAINGIAQATGWSGNVGTMAGWFHKHERGKVMGAWSTNFTVGSISALLVMGAVLGLAASYGGDWRWCFYTGAGVLVVIWVQFYFFQRNRPEDVGLPPVDDPHTPADESKEPLPRAAIAGQQKARSIGDIIRSLGLSRDAWINLFLVGGFYFFAKLIRYAVWGWAIYILQNNFKVASDDANYYSIAFGALGLPGVYVTGWLSDKYFGSRRAGISTLMMFGMMIATGALILFGDISVAVFMILLGCVGFTLFGHDALLTGAGAIDIGGRRAATFAAGFISGLGSMGPIVQALVIGRLYKKGDLTPVFGFLFGSAVLATVFCIVLVLRNRKGGKGI